MTNDPMTLKMAKIKITQVKSGIDRSERQKLTLKALGLNKMNATREVEATPQILGMVKKVITSLPFLTEYSPFPS